MMVKYRPFLYTSLASLLLAISISFLCQKPKANWDIRQAWPLDKHQTHRNQNKASGNRKPNLLPGKCCIFQSCKQLDLLSQILNSSCLHFTMSYLSKFKLSTSKEIIFIKTSLLLNSLTQTDSTTVKNILTLVFYKA